MFRAGAQTNSAWITGWLRVIKASYVKTRAINRRCPGRDSDCSVLGVPPQLALPPVFAPAVAPADALTAVDAPPSLAPPVVAAVNASTAVVKVLSLAALKKGVL